MKKIIDFFVRNPIWANAVIFLTVLFGIISIGSINKSFFPELDSTRIFVNVFYPGASPVEMEEGVTIKVEEALKGLSDIEEVNSVSSENSASITVTAYQGTDMDVLLSEVKNAIDGISSFPAGAEKPIVFRQKTNGMAARTAFISLSGDADLMELKKMSEKIESDLLNSGVVSQIEISGLPALEIAIEVKEQELLRYNLSFDAIVNAVRLNNRDVSGGTIKTNKEELVIRSRAKTNVASEIGNIIIRTTTNGDIIYVKDVATVTFQFAETPFKSFLNNKRNITFNIQKLPNEDLGAIAGYIDEYVEQFNANSKNMQLDILFQFYDMLNQRMDLLINNGVIGLILVLITLGLFLSLRLSGWVAFGIPFSFLGMFIIGAFYGMTINMISLFGMIVVVGILVDDGIVIAENIFAHYEKGKTPLRAAIDGTVEVMSSVFTSVLTTIVAFSVLFFIEGLEMMAEMAFVVIACLAFSLIEAFLVLPSHLSSKAILKEPKEGAGKKFRNYINKRIIYVRDTVYGSLLSLFIKRKWIAVFMPIIFGVAVISLISSKIIPVTFFPSIPFDDFTVEVAYEPGSREMQTEKTLRWAQQKIWEVNQEIIEETGDTLVTNTTLQIGYTENIGESGSHAGLVRVSLDGEGKKISSFEVASRVREKIGQIPGVYKMAVGGGNRWGKPVSIALSGIGYESMKGSMQMLKDSLKTLATLKDVTDNAGSGRREVLIDLKPKAYLLGLNHNEITRQIRQGFFGEEAQRLIVGTDEVRIWVRYPEEDRSAMWQLDQMRVKTQTGQLIPLIELCTYNIERGVVNINHYNGKREILIEADLVDPYASVPEILQEVKQKFVPIVNQMYPDVQVNFRGQQRNAEKAGNSGGIMLTIALFLMFLIITLNFQSMYQAGLIFIVLPAGIFSAILGHGIHHLPVSILSAWGMVALLGIMVNDAVVFLDTYNRNLLAGMNTKEAIYAAGISRFRPILLTSITTVAGLFPLILEQSFQAQFLIPMATSVAYGVLFGTLFILFFFPPLVLCLNDFRKARKQWWNMKKYSAEEVEPIIARRNRLNELDA